MKKNLPKEPIKNEKQQKHIAKKKQRKFKMLLGVNIDHIAVLREARKVADPDPLDALSICKLAGADQITIHLREDRRHIQDQDAQDIIRMSALPVNLECASSLSMIDIACKLKPHRVTLVPEKREEVTTEGGLLLEGTQLSTAIKALQEAEIEVSLFIDPSREAIDASLALGVEWIEFHTGKYANIYAMLYSRLAKTPHAIPSLKLSRKVLKQMLDKELLTLKKLSKKAKKKGLRVAAGHGLNMQNVQEIVKIESIEELNIGQSIIARSIFVGLEQAIIDIKKEIKR
jgi:pyridoxine 5-phosphate synthase